MTALEQLLEPGALTAVYQPIFDMSGPSPTVFAYECLTRGPEGTNFEAADVLFEYVRRKREESRVDRACVVAALEGARRIPAAPGLTINVHASTLTNDRTFADFLVRAARASGTDPSRLTVEIVEHSPTFDDRRFLEMLEELRRREVRIALDDVGLGQSNFKMIVDAMPDFLKIDRYFVHSCHSDRSRRVVARSIAELARQFDAAPIAEGLELAEDLEVLRDLGISLFQGYLLGRPTSARELAAAS
jgi:EAL domain-containing protein (putative c-di-GMP-specific phosphodiesterase class I)